MLFGGCVWGWWLQCVFLALAFSFTLCRDMNQRRYIDPITSKHLEQSASVTEGETHTRYVRSWMPVFTDRRLLLVVGSRNQSVLCVVGVCVCVCVYVCMFMCVLSVVESFVVAVFLSGYFLFRLFLLVVVVLLVMPISLWKRLWRYSLPVQSPSKTCCSSEPRWCLFTCLLGWSSF